MEVETITDEERNKIASRYAHLSFANLKRNIVQDLINNRNESVIYSKYTKEQIVTMLENPQKNEKQIRELSGFLCLVSSHYRRLIDYIASILLYNYTIIPTKIQNKKPTRQYLNDYYTVINYADNCNIRHEAEKSIKIAARDGVFYGICYSTEDSFYIKPFDPRYAKVSSVEDGCLLFSVDMAYFSGKEYLLDMYGAEFRRAYEAYKGNKEKGTQGDKTKKWYEVPNSICVKADETDLIYSLPLFAGALLSILDIEDYRMLHKAKSEADNYKILSAEIETEDGVPKMDFDIARKWFIPMVDELPDGVGAFLSPFKIGEHTFSSSQSSDRNDVDDAISSFWQSGGTTAALFGGTKLTSSSAIMLSVKPDESLAFSFLKQFERCLNRFIKKLNLKNGFKIKFSNQSIFNLDEHTNRLSKAATYGVPVKLEYATAVGLSPSEILGNTQLENVLGLCDTEWNKPLISSNTMSSDALNDGGRPTAEENGESVSDSSQNTRDSGANDNR